MFSVVDPEGLNFTQPKAASGLCPESV